MSKKTTGKKSKLFPAYTDDKPTYKTRKQKGVYFIYDKNKKLVYIGYSGSCLYTALNRHFQQWNDKRQKRFVYPRDYFVRVILTTQKRAALLEKYLILRMKPEDNLQKYENYLSADEIKEVKTISENIAPATAEDDVPF